MTAESPLTDDETLATLADSVAEYFAWDDNDGRSQHLAAHLLAAVESILSARETALRETIAQEIMARGDDLSPTYSKAMDDAIHIVRGQA